MFWKTLFCLFFWGFTSVEARAAKDFELTNSGLLYTVKDVKLNKNNVWLAVHLVNRSSSKDWFIQIPHPVKEADLYTKRKEGGYTVVKLNLNTLYSESSIKVGGGYVLPLHLDQGESQPYFLRIKNSYKLNTSVYIGTLKTIYENQHRKNLAIGFIFGTLLALMIYNLYIYIAIKDTSYLYYVGYILCSIVFLVVWNGYFMKEIAAWNLRILTVSSAALFLFSLLFADGYLRVAHFANKLFKFRKWLVIVFLIPVVILLLSDEVFAFQWLQVSLIVAVVYWIVACYFSLKNQYKPAVYYLLSLLFVLGSYVFYELYHSAISLPIGLFLQALTLSFMLAVKLNNLKRENSQLQKNRMLQTSSFSKELIVAQENEKEQIANELNEGVGQQLVLLKNEIFAIKKQSDGAQDEVIAGIIEDIGKAIEEVSNVSFSLRPYQLNALGLKLAIESLIEGIQEHTDTGIHLHVDKIDHLLDKGAEMNFYRIIQELLNNLIKHAEARDCWMHIKNKKTQLRFYYRDNGKGFDTENTSMGLGLSGIRERCKLIQADIRMLSKPNSGTKIFIKIPNQT